MKTVKKIVAVTIAAVMMLSLASCGDNSWIVKYNGREIPTGVYTYYVYNAYEMLTYYGTINPEEKLNGQTVADDSDADAVDSETAANEVPAEEYINNYALEQVLYLCELWDRYEAAGLSMDEATIADKNEHINDEYEQYKDLYVTNGVAKTSVEIASAQGMFGIMQDQLFNHLYGEGGTQQVTKDELKTFFLDNHVGYSYVYESLVKDGLPLSDDEKAAVKTRLEGVKSDVEKGKKKFEDVVKEYSDAYVADSTAGKYGAPESVVKKNSESELMLALLEIEAGKLGYVEIDNYAFLLKRHDLNSMDYFEKNQEMLLESYKLEGFQKDIMDTAKAASYELNKNAYKQFGIRKLDIDGVTL